MKRIVQHKVGRHMEVFGIEVRGGMPVAGRLIYTHGQSDGAQSLLAQSTLRGAECGGAIFDIVFQRNHNEDCLDCAIGCRNPRSTLTQLKTQLTQ